MLSKSLYYMLYRLPTSYILLSASINNIVLLSRDKVSLVRRYTGGGTVVVDENTSTYRSFFAA